MSFNLFRSGAALTNLEIGLLFLKALAASHGWLFLFSSFVSKSVRVKSNLKGRMIREFDPPDLESMTSGQ